MAEDAMWKPHVSFPDGSESFVHGFEAGMAWQRITGGDTDFEMQVHIENESVLHNMANAEGYQLEFTPYAEPDFSGWAIAHFTKRPQRGGLNVIK